MTKASGVESIDNDAGSRGARGTSIRTRDTHPISSVGGPLHVVASGGATTTGVRFMACLLVFSRTSLLKIIPIELEAEIVVKNTNINTRYETECRDGTRSRAFLNFIDVVDVLGKGQKIS